MQIIRVLLFSLLIAASSPTSSSKSPHSSNPQKEKPTGKNDNGSQAATLAEESKHSSDDQRGEKKNKKEGGKLKRVAHGGGEEGEDSLGQSVELDDGRKGPPQEGTDRGGGVSRSSSRSSSSNGSDERGSESKRENGSNGGSVFESLLSFLNGGNFGDYNKVKQTPFHSEEGNSKDETSHEEKLTSQFWNILKSSEMNHTVGGKISTGRMDKAKQCSYSYAPFDQMAKKKAILDRSLEEDNVGESASVKGEQQPLGDGHQGENPQEGEEAEKVDETDHLGEHPGDHFGDHLGDHFGDHSGDHFGDHSGDHFGDHSGDHFGDHPGDLLGDHLGEEGEGEGTRDFFNFEKEFMKREEEEGGGGSGGGTAEQVGERETNVTSHSRGNAKGKAGDGTPGRRKGKKKGSSHKEQKKKKKNSVAQAGVEATGGAKGDDGARAGEGDHEYPLGSAPSGETEDTEEAGETEKTDETDETDETDALLINKPEAIKYFFEVLTEVCAIIKLGVIHRFTHVVIPLKNIIVSKTLRQIEVILMTMLSVHRLGSHKYRDTYGLGIIALLLYLLTYLIRRYIYKGEKKGRDQHSAIKADDVYVVNLLRRLLYLVETKKTVANSDEGVMHDVLYNTETLLATTNITNKENKQIYTDIIASINNLGIFTYVSTQALKSINQKSDLLISGFTGGRAMRAGEGEEEGMLDMHMNMDLDMDMDMNPLDVDALDGSALGGSALGGSALGGSALGGSALGVSLGGMGAALGKRGFPNGMGMGLPNSIGAALRSGMDAPVPPGAGGHIVDDLYDVNNMQNNFGDGPLYGENSVRNKMRYSMMQQHSDKFEEGDLLDYKKGSANYDFAADGHGANSGGNFRYKGVDGGANGEYPKQGGGDFLKEDMNSRSSFSHVSKPSNHMNGDEIPPQKKDDLANHVAGPQAAFFDDPPSGAAAPPKKDSLQNFAPPPLSYMPPTHQVLESASSRNQKYLTQRKERQKIVATKSPFN
ncbi:hypothetical protein PCYB_021550 [Plasmodium cynomolgi strain B]|uniref:Secreted ookinete protein n=1 Tax=Plasmodium cynomolgi (strain B) TaxID=1120755 RepID=K6UCC0_PLACD|nr:hypothetical protein PCYB_021550 [Plasmodium cynomolgi strain B]GAB64586.1 hypothetical protein PCYB_021550 [Plasmodium cynomolgi strain B]